MNLKPYLEAMSFASVSLCPGSCTAKEDNRRSFTPGASPGERGDAKVVGNSNQKCKIMLANTAEDCISRAEFLMMQIQPAIAIASYYDAAAA